MISKSAKESSSSETRTVVVHIDRQLAERVRARFSGEAMTELNIRQTVERALRLAEDRK